MTPLAARTLLLGTGIFAVGLPIVLQPRFAAVRLRALPRSITAGRLLSAIAVGWSGWMLYRAPFDFLQPFRSWIPILIPVAIAMTWLLLDELLGCRSIGALAVLLPTPLLAAVRAHDEPLRVVVTLTAYAMAVAGMALLTSPHLLRRAIDGATQNPRSLRICGAAACAVGATLVWLAVSVY